MAMDLATFLLVKAASSLALAIRLVSAYYDPTTT